jgi:5'-nucleotidase
MPRLRLLPLLLVLLGAAPLRAEPVTLTILHLNDVYEITRPGKRELGGLTRVATLQRQLKARNPNTISILAGDFFAPSALGTGRVDGQRLDGRHMVAVLNAMKLDFATFGNHEFDIPKGPFLDRLKEAKFQWFSGNISDAEGKPFPMVDRFKILTFKGPGGEVRVALLGLTVETGKGNPANYWRYRDYLTTAWEQVRQIRESGAADLVVAVTHLNLYEDIRLAREVPGIDLILGGHEHENNSWRSRTPGQPPIFKADANVRTVYVHHLRFDPLTRQLDTESQLLTMTNQVPEDPATVKATDYWIRRGFAALEEATGRDPRDVVLRTRCDLEGREAYVRRGKTNLTELVASALRAAVKGSDLALYNAGMIRIDDLIPAGPLTFYDVLRILPYGGSVHAAEVKGRLLARLFDRGLSERMYGEGDFLQAAAVAPGKWAGEWLVSGKPLEPERTYRVAINDYLLAGWVKKLAGPGEMKDLGKSGDLREVVIRELIEKCSEDPKPPPTPVEGKNEGATPGWWLVAIFCLVFGALAGFLARHWRRR